MTQSTIDINQLEQIILQKLPTLIQKNPQIQELVLELARQNFADRQATEDRFYQILNELRHDREEQAHKWAEQRQQWEDFKRELQRDREEQAQKWDEQNQKWNEQNRKWDEQNQKWNEQNRKWDDFKQELQRNREEQARKWDEQNQKWNEQNRKWDEQNQKWNEQNRKWDDFKQELQHNREEQALKWAEQHQQWEDFKRELQRDREEQASKWNEQNQRWEDAKLEFAQMHAAIIAIAQKQERSIGALGARWGIQAESSFRNALAGILETSFGVKVINVNENDAQGEVFGRPDQVELDVIIKNGLLIICEIKSSIDKAGMYIFERKVRFYEKRYQRQANRLIVISPMVDAKAQTVAQRLGIEVYSDSVDIKSL